MIDNRALLQELFDCGKIRLQRDSFLDTEPPAIHPLDPERMEGMLWGLAIGDSLGNTSESRPPRCRRKKYGEIRDYLSTKHAEGRCVGVPSDDTQMAFRTIEQLLEDDGLVPDHLAQWFCRKPIFGIGKSVRTFIECYEGGLPWDEAGVQSAGNGALMRIAPILLPHLRRPSPALWADVALAAMITHNDPGSTAACVAYIHLLWQVLGMTAPPPRGWWLETFCRVAGRLEGQDTRYENRGQSAYPHKGPLWAFAEKVVRDALARELSVEEACDAWYSGAYVFETVPCVLYILEVWGHDPEEAIVRAVNDTWDNDTVAAIVGAAVGALHGVSALPQRWRDGLLGRTGVDDDGRIQSLIARARATWLEG